MPSSAMVFLENSEVTVDASAISDVPTPGKEMLGYSYDKVVTLRSLYVTVS
jgi:hypothetical protein